MKELKWLEETLIKRVEDAKRDEDENNIPGRAIYTGMIIAYESALYLVQMQIKIKEA